VKSIARWSGAAVVAAAVVGTAVPGMSATAAPTATTRPTSTSRPSTTPAPTTTRPGTTIPSTSSTSTTAAPTTTSTAPRRRNNQSTTTAPTTGTPAPAPGPPGVSLVSQSPWIPTRGSEVIALHLDEPALAAVAGAAVQVTVHHSVSSRTDFENAISGASLGGIGNAISFPLSAVQINDRRDFLIGFGLTGSDAPRRIGLDSPGVYPVEIGVIASGIDRGTFLTWMVVVDPGTARASQPLRVSWIWRLETPPVEPPSGAIDPAALSPLRPGGRLDHIATLLERAGNFPLTLGIPPGQCLRPDAEREREVAGALEQRRDVVEPAARPQG